MRFTRFTRLQAFDIKYFYITFMEYLMAKAINYVSPVRTYCESLFTSMGIQENIHRTYTYAR